jgi:acetolactate synthase-1/2/3 large subunit
MSNRYEGGDLLVESLKALGVERIFSVSGGPLNSLYHAADAHGIALVHTRHEAAAAFMAEAGARITGTPGVAAVTLGPGVTNTVTPALVSRMAGTPLLILGAQVATQAFDRGAGMSADHLPIMAPVTKWSARVLQTARIPEYIETAWRIMWSGRPGPVFLELPVDVLAAPAEPGPNAAYRASRPGLDEDGAKTLAGFVAEARRPLLIIGDDARWDAPASLEAMIERLQLPFFTARLARGCVDEHHPLWAGPAYVPANATLKRALGEADLVIVLGHHFEFDLGFGEGVNGDARIVQCCVEPDLLSRNRRATLALLASSSAVAGFMATLPSREADASWIGATAAAWRDEREAQAGDDPASLPLHPVAAVDAVVSAMPEDTIYVTSHGNVDFWADARLRVRAPDCYLRAGQAGALGAEIPYAIGARFACPDRPVVVFVGDGGVGYHAMELDTAARYDRPVIVVVLDDEKWSAIALPQRQSYGGEFEMALPRRDWPRLAESLGGFGARAETPGEIADAVRAASASGRPAIVQVPVRSVLSPYMANISK